MQMRHLALALFAALLLQLIATYGFGQEPAQCVQVNVVDHNGGSGGTGALIGPQLIVTAWHVVNERKTDAVSVVFPSEKVVAGKVIKIDKKQDLALIELDELSGVEPLRLSIQERWEPGDSFDIMGYGSRKQKFRRASGTLNATGYSNGWKEVKGASARSGDSGGPVLDSLGRYAGTLWGSDGRGTMFSPVNIVTKLVLSVGRDLEVPENVPYDIGGE